MPMPTSKTRGKVLSAKGSRKGRRLETQTKKNIDTIGEIKIIKQQ